MKKTVALIIGSCLAVTGFGIITGQILYRMGIDVRTDKAKFFPAAATNVKTKRTPLPKEMQTSTETLEQIVYKDCWITSDDGLLLHGYLHQQTGAPLLSNVAAAKREHSHQWVILVHGYDDDGLWFQNVAPIFAQEGYHAVLPDARGHGKSQGIYIGMGWHDRLDLLRWIDWILQQDAAASIVLYGVSMGGAAVMMLAGEDLPVQVKVIVEDCGYTSAWEELAYQLKEQFHLPALPFLYCASFITKWRAGFWLQEANALKQIKKTRVPVLFMHGSADTFVPVDMADRLYQACPAAKELYVVEGAAHAKAAKVGGETYWKHVFQFISRFR